MVLTQTSSYQRSLEPSSPDSIVGAADHKIVGRFFIAAAIVAMLGGLIVSLLAALESANADGFQFLANANEYTQLWSAGSEVLLLGAVIPLLVGIGVFVVPLQVGSPSLAFARGGAAAFWVWLFGLLLLAVAYAFNGGPGGGRPDLVMLWAVSLSMMTLGLLWALVCLVTTIWGARTLGMTLERAPLTAWSYFVFGLIGLVSLPMLIAELMLSYMRVRHGQLAVTESGSLHQVMDSLRVAPATFWMGIPILGIVADIAATHGKRVPQTKQVAAVAIGVFGVLTFFPDLVGFASVREIPLDNAVRVITLLVIALPLLIAAMAGGVFLLLGRLVRPAALGALLGLELLSAAVVVSILGQVQAVMGFLEPFFSFIDMSNTLILNGTTFHEGVRVLATGAVFVLASAALNHWGVKLWGRQLSASQSSLSIVALTVGTIVWAAAEVAAGFMDRPMYPAIPESPNSYTGLGWLAVLGVALMVAGAISLLLDVLSTMRYSRAGSGAQDWSGHTLEWATASPPPLGNFPGVAVVGSHYPLLDSEVEFETSSVDSPREDV